MQIGVGGGPCGTVGDEYGPLRRFLSDPLLGPQDPTTAVEFAALVLIKDKGAPTGQPIDGYSQYVLAHNGLGPDGGGVCRPVIADAHAYQGAGTVAFAGCAAAAAITYVNPFAGEDWAPSRTTRGGLRPAEGGADPRDRRRHDRRHRVVGQPRAVV